MAFGLVYWKRLSLGILRKDVIHESDAIAYAGLIKALQALGLLLLQEYGWVTTGVEQLPLKKVMN